MLPYTDEVKLAIVRAINCQPNKWLKKELSRKEGRLTREEIMRSDGIYPNFTSYISYFNIPQNKLPLTMRLGRPLTIQDIDSYEQWWIGIRVKFAHKLINEEGINVCPTKSIMVSHASVCEKLAPPRDAVTFVENGLQVSNRLHLATYFYNDDKSEHLTWTVSAGYECRKQAEEMAAYLFGQRKLKDPIIQNGRKVFSQRSHESLCTGWEIRKGKRTQSKWEIKIWGLAQTVLDRLMEAALEDEPAPQPAPVIEQPKVVEEVEETETLTPPGTVDSFPRDLKSLQRILDSNPNMIRISRIFKDRMKELGLEYDPATNKLTELINF